MIQKLLIIIAVLTIQINIVEGAIQKQDSLINNDIFMKMMPQRATIFDVYNLELEENRIFREGDQVVYTTTEKRKKHRGKIIGFQDGKMIIYNKKTDKRVFVPIDEVITIRRKYNLKGISAGLSLSLGIYFLFVSLAAAILFGITLAVQNIGNQFLGEIFLSLFASISSLLIGIAVSITSVSIWSRYKKYNLTKNWSAKLFEVRPLEK